MGSKRSKVRPAYEKSKAQGPEDEGVVYEIVYSPREPVQIDRTPRRVVCVTREEREKLKTSQPHPNPADEARREAEARWHRIRRLIADYEAALGPDGDGPASTFAEADRALAAELRKEHRGGAVRHHWLYKAVARKGRLTVIRTRIFRCD